MPKPDGAEKILANLFNRYNKDDVTVSTAYIETKSNILREWYRKGQQAFRHLAHTDKVEFLNDVLQELEGDARDGFLMGWNSDAYADQHNLGLSIEGTHRQEIEDVNFAWQT
jgi:hypothetical protein